MNAHEKLVELLKKECDDSGMTYEDWDEHMRKILARTVRQQDGEG